MKRAPFPDSVTAEELTIKNKKGVIKKIPLKKEDDD